jgi:hypothetical protein
MCKARKDNEINRTFMITQTIANIFRSDERVLALCKKSFFFIVKEGSLA